MLQFEWDNQKNALNQKRHGVSFEVAVLIFNDPNIVTFLDTRIDYGEDRWISIGMAGQTVLIVVHTLREGYDGEEVIRIISARKATTSEERR
ncbi:MAG: BrnT family toxin [Deltaproteobacteria bacterium]|nr:BrnT family toxin [Deltaproteobacteria bacterium]